MLVFQHVAEVLGFQTPLSLHRGIAAAQIVVAHRPGLAAVPHFSSQFACICEQDAVTDLQPSCASTPWLPSSPRTSTESRIFFMNFPRRPVRGSSSRFEHDAMLEAGVRGHKPLKCIEVIR
ncbi:hypothetical protein DK419_03995 [Methylobacterium terrae]|uniref:Uncharacterized protein n=1 Tax=Methylobacterium terrae TaxID=2202827 RepID=A0A2U8WHF3_9HYPH|nr:hypothetical protein DK419_03995 [Methylobacterium terrae]